MSQRTSQLGARALLVVGVVALAARLVHFYVASEDELFHGLFLDSRYYAEQAQVLHGGGGADSPYLLSPLYPYLLVPFVGADGQLDVDWVRRVQALLGAATAMLAAAIAARAATPLAGWIAGLIVALYGPLIHYDSFVLVAGPQTFCLTLGLWILLRARRWRGFFLCGLVLGLSAALRPTGLAVVVGIAVAMLAAGRIVGPGAAPWRARVLRSVALLAGTALVVLPFTVRNGMSSGEFVLLSANGGFNFWVGNHSGSHGRFIAPPGYDFKADPVGRDLAIRESGRQLSHVEASNWWWSQAVEDMAEAPFRSLAHFGSKLLLFAHPKEIPQLGAGFEWHRDRAWTLRLPLDGRQVLILVLFAPIVAWLGGGRRAVERIGWPLWVLATYVVAVALFFVAGRYRAPVMPTAIALGVVCGIELVRLVREQIRARPRPVLAVLVALLACGAVSYPLYLGASAPLAVPGSTGIEERQQGVALFYEGRYAEAIEAFRSSLAVHDDPITRINLANTLRTMGRNADAAAQYELALEGDPLNGVGWYNYADLLRLQRDWEKAEDAYGRTIQLQPAKADAHLNLAGLLLDQNRLDEAIPILERALELARPDTPWRASATQTLNEVKRAAAAARGDEGS